MNDWFEWNGVRCTEYGIHVLEHPPQTVPAERATFTDVPGRSGSLTTLEGDNVYDDMVLTASCLIADPNRIPEIAAWLKGSGTVTFANREGGFYYARVVNQIPFEKVLRGNPHRRFSVNFRCKPFFHLDDSSDTVIAHSGDFITNPGCVASEPIITVTGNGDITLMVGMQMIELTDVDGKITIDSVLQEVYNDDGACNEKMEGDFPVLQPGVNAISWDGDVTRVVVSPNWRTL